MKKVLRPDLQKKLIGRFNQNGIWVECARDPKTHNIVAVTIEYSDKEQPDSYTVEVYENGYSVVNQAINSKEFYLYVPSVFRSGFWDGKDVTKKESLQQIITNYKKLVNYGKDRVPIILDHGRDGSKGKVGYIRDLKIDKNNIQPGEFVLLDPIAIEKVLIGLWDSISPFIFYNHEVEIGEREKLSLPGWSLYEVSIVVHPRDSKLDIKFSTEERKEVPMSVHVNPPGDPQDTPTIDPTPSPAPTTGAPKDGSQSQSQTPPTTGGENQTQHVGISMSDALEQIRVLTEENQTLKGSNLQMSNDVKGYMKRVETLEQASLQREAEDAIKSLEMSGRLMPAQHEKWVGHYLKMSDEMRKDWVGMMKDAPQVISFGRSTPPAASDVQKQIDDIKANLARYNYIEFDDKKGGK